MRLIVIPNSSISDYIAWIKCHKFQGTYNVMRRQRGLIQTSLSLR